MSLWVAATLEPFIETADQEKGTGRILEANTLKLAYILGVTLD